MIFDLETLEMLYDEASLPFDYSIYEGLSDKEIYKILPADIKAMLTDYGLHASWMHDGM